jgi:hypothetical protein
MDDRDRAVRCYATGEPGQPSGALDAVSRHPAALRPGLSKNHADVLAIEVEAFARYAQAIQTDADSYGLDLAGERPIEDDDWWREKLDLLLQTPVALVSLTFGIPERGIIDALLRAEESGASAVHKAALADPLREETIITRAFTGCPARALRNQFIDRHDAQAPLGYPAVHHLTNRLRKAATAAGDPEHVHLWAGTGYRHTTEEPVADILRRLSRNL